MAEFAKRAEITVGTMGKVENPSGEGIHAVSSQAQAKAAKHQHNQQQLETKVKEGTAKRNIARKKSTDAQKFHKKQGGHGKGQWNMQAVVDASEMPIDEDDPLYDEAQDAKYVLSSGEGILEDQGDKRGYDEHTKKAVYGPLLTNQEFKARVTVALLEYFDSCDGDEFIRTVEELGCQEFHYEMVKKIISISMDKTCRERELTSRLLTCLHPYPLSLQDMQNGFDLLLNSVDDLACDVPEAPTMAASFLARAVVDEVVPPAFLSEQNNERVGDAVVSKAVALLSREHYTARLEHVWGPGDGRDVDGLKKEMDILLQEYLSSRELDEAARCVQELQAPHFHHELVKRGAFISMTMKDPSTHLDAMAALLGFLVRNAICSEFQVHKGLQRLHTRLSDIQLDVPKAPELLKAFEGYCMEQECLPTKATTRSE